MRIKLPKFFQHIVDYVIIKRSRLFDEGYYVENAPEVQKTTRYPILHYVRVGWRQGYDPSPNFNTSYYLSEYPDVLNAGINPLVHYYRKGLEEGRLPRQAMHRIYPRYPLWVTKYDTLTHKDKRQIKAKIKHLSHQPRFTIFIILNPENVNWIKQTLSSLQSQLYPHWEARLFYHNPPYLAFDLSPFKKFLRDPRLSWVAYARKPERIACLNISLESCSGDFFGFLPQGARLSPHALYLLAHAVNQQANAAVLYTDEDQLNANNLRICPDFKPEWNPELFYSQDFLNDFAVYRMDKVRGVGGFHHVNPSLLVFDLALRIIENISPDAIQHIPFVLCHKPDSAQNQSTTSDHHRIISQRLGILKSHFNRMDQRVEIQPGGQPGNRIEYPLPDPEPPVSIIIPTRNGQQILARCLESIFLHTSYEHFEILIVDNQSDDPATLAYLEELKQNDKITLLPYHKPFNFSAINNHAAQAAQGEILVFLNNDVEVITPNWLTTLVRHALRPQIGAVGAMLYYPDDTIQHAGVVLGLNGPAGHIYKGQPRGYLGLKNRAALVQNIDAVTGACMALEKKKFLQVSGFDEEHLPIAFNDIDLCLRLMQAGYRNLWTPQVELYHYESFTRGIDVLPVNIPRFTNEAEYLCNTYRELIYAQPAYHPNLALLGTDLKLAFPPRVNNPWWAEF
jgi:O-antigen biosynthesis protein